MKTWILLLMNIMMISCASEIDSRVSLGIQEYLDQHIDDPTNINEIKPEIGNPSKGPVRKIQIMELRDFKKEFSHPTQLIACSDIAEVHPHYTFPDLETNLPVPDSIRKAYGEFRYKWLHESYIDSNKCSMIKEYVDSTPAPFSGYLVTTRVRIIREILTEEIDLVFNLNKDYTINSMWYLTDPEVY